MIAYDELLKKRRAVRNFKDQDVPESILYEIIEETCLAPSAGNRQPWRFVIISNRDWIKRLSDESKANFLEDIQKNPDAPVKQYEAVLKLPDFNVFYNAPCLVLIAGNSAIRTLAVDCALAAAYFMLSAAARGLGTCWVDLGGNIRSQGTLGELGLKTSHRIIAPIIIGYPTLIPDIPKRVSPVIVKIVK
jgi:nitroreductase